MKWKKIDKKKTTKTDERRFSYIEKCECLTKKPKNSNFGFNFFPNEFQNDFVTSVFFVRP